MADTAPGAPPPAPPPPLTERVPTPGERARMVGWYHPPELLRTAGQVIVSSLFASNADRRVLDAVVDGTELHICDAPTTGPLWIDYVSDTGDGWNPTYAIASHLAQPTLSLPGVAIPTKRGDILVFGGDEVYPTPGRKEYEQRLVAPYRTALPHSSAPHPHVYAIPGNHDWYDSLVAFSGIFCDTVPRWFGGWLTQQRRSYFAVRLPHRWWLIGIDVQLQSDIDKSQLDYFRRVAAEMKPGDHVMLCTAEPQWIYQAKYNRYDSTITERNLDYLDSTVFREQRIAVWLAGDLHHYRRHATDLGDRQKITAGGGGAFLHPTHGDDHRVADLNIDDAPSEVYRHKCSYPDVGTSRRIGWRNFAFPFYNPTFGIATGVLYLLFAWAVQPRMPSFGIENLPEAVRQFGIGVVHSQTAFLWFLLIGLGFYAFTDTHNETFKKLAGPLHGFAHIVAAFTITWGASSLAAHGFAVDSLNHLMATAVLIVAGGYLTGALIMGLYLFVALNICGRQGEEAFSALKCEDYKSWLRMSITPGTTPGSGGDLTIYPIRIERVPKAWVPAMAGASSVSRLVPTGTHTLPELIEAPIPVRFDPDWRPSCIPAR